LKNRPTVKHPVAGSCHFCISDQSGSRFRRPASIVPLTQILANSRDDAPPPRPIEIGTRIESAANLQGTQPI
jgi:hypothetical protein